MPSKPLPLASKVPAKEGSNTKIDEQNVDPRIKRKHARRVSFADTEITSGHIFNRDDDYETASPDSKPTNTNNKVIGFFRDLGSDIDDSSDDVEGNIDARKSFLRPLGLPLPGSSTIGSVTSNDGKFFLFSLAIVVY